MSLLLSLAQNNEVNNYLLFSQSLIGIKIQINDISGIIGEGLKVGFYYRRFLKIQWLIDINNTEIYSVFNEPFSNNFSSQYYSVPNSLIKGVQVINNQKLFYSIYEHY